MTNLHAPKANPQNPSIDIKTLQNAVAAIDMGRFALSELGDILSAIVKLGEDNEVINRLASLGTRLHDRHYELLDDAYDEMAQRLLIANGGKHV